MFTSFFKFRLMKKLDLLQIAILRQIKYTLGNKMIFLFDSILLFNNFEMGVLTILSPLQRNKRGKGH